MNGCKLFWFAIEIKHADAVSHERHSTGSWIHDLAIVNAVKYKQELKSEDEEEEQATHRPAAA